MGTSAPPLSVVLSSDFRERFERLLERTEGKVRWVGKMNGGIPRFFWQAYHKFGLRSRRLQWMINHQRELPPGQSVSHQCEDERCMTSSCLFLVPYGLEKRAAWLRKEELLGEAIVNGVLQRNIGPVWCRKSRAKAKIKAVMAPKVIKTPTVPAVSPSEDVVKTTCLFCDVGYETTGRICQDIVRDIRQGYDVDQFDVAYVCEGCRPVGVTGQMGLMPSFGYIKPGEAFTLVQAMAWSEARKDFSLTMAVRTLDSEGFRSHQKTLLYDNQKHYTESAIA